MINCACEASSARPHILSAARQSSRQIAYVPGKGGSGCPKRVAALGCSTGEVLPAPSLRPLLASRTPSACRWSASLRRPVAAAPAGTTTALRDRGPEVGRAAADAGGRRLLRRAEANLHRARARKFGQLDMLVYSMAAPVRTDPDTGKTWRSAIKPLGAAGRDQDPHTETGEVYETTIAPASEDEADATVAVMGGETGSAGSTARGRRCFGAGLRTLNYTYIGSELTWPIYWKARSAAPRSISTQGGSDPSRLGQDAARVVALKAVVTQASSAIPVVPLYGTVLFKVMKQLGLHEGCIEQIDRLFRTRLGKGSKSTMPSDPVDDWELSPEFRRRCCGAGRCLRRRRSANWPILGNTKASSCGCSDWHRRRRLRTGRRPPRRYLSHSRSLATVHGVVLQILSRTHSNVA